MLILLMTLVALTGFLASVYLQYRAAKRRGHLNTRMRNFEGEHWATVAALLAALVLLGYNLWRLGANALDGKGPNMVALLAGVWSWMDKNAAGLGAAAALATAAVAVFALATTAADSRARTRPLVIAEFRKAKDNDTTVDLVIQNYGQTAARDLEVVFSPELALPVGKERMAQSILDRYLGKRLLLSPGGALQNIWWSGTSAGAEGVDLINAEATPNRITVVLKYSGTGRKPYTDTFELDVNVILTTTSSISSSSPRGKLNFASDSLGALAASAKKIDREFSRGVAFLEAASKRSPNKAALRTGRNRIQL